MHTLCIALRLHICACGERHGAAEAAVVPATCVPHAGCTLRAEFEQTDALGVTVESQGQLFDVVTCMFALHYFFERQDCLFKLLEATALNLKPGEHLLRRCWFESSLCVVCSPDVSEHYLSPRSMSPPPFSLPHSCSCFLCTFVGGYFIGCVPDGRRIKTYLQKHDGLLREPHLLLKQMWEVSSQNQSAEKSRSYICAHCRCTYMPPAAACNAAAVVTCTTAAACNAADVVNVTTLLHPLTPLRPTQPTPGRTCPPTPACHPHTLIPLYRARMLPLAQRTSWRSLIPLWRATRG